MSGTSGASSADDEVASALGGWRNSMAVGLCGLDIEAKAEVVTNQLWATVAGGRDAFDETETRLVRTDSPDATGNEAATAWLRVTVWDDDEKRAGRAFSGAATELALSSIPGFYASTPPGSASSLMAALTRAPQRDVAVDPGQAARRCRRGHRDGRPLQSAQAACRRSSATNDLTADDPADPALPNVPDGLASLIGARSGDKGGSANVGVFARSDEAWHWLQAWLTTDRLRQLAPAETDGLVVHRYRLDNLRALGLSSSGCSAGSPTAGPVQASSPCPHLHGPPHFPLLAPSTIVEFCTPARSGQPGRRRRRSDTSSSARNPTIVGIEPVRRVQRGTRRSSMSNRYSE
jgi:hypothetical protein